MEFIKPFLASITATDDPAPEIVEMREKLLALLLLSFTILSAAPVGLGSYLSLRNDQPVFALAYPVLYAMVFLAAVLGRRLSFRVRANALLVFGVGIGVTDLFRVGLGGVGVAALTAFSVIAAILYGVRAGLAVLALSIVSVIVAGAALLTGLVQPESEALLTTYSPVAWITAAMIITLFALVLILAPETFRRRLQLSLREEERKTEDLTRTVGKLRQEVEARIVAEAALGESERRFRQLAELLPETVFETDLEARLTFVNRACVEVFGYTEAELTSGMTAIDMLVRDDVERAASGMVRVMRGEDLGLREYTARHKSGAEIPILLRSAPVHRGGELIGLRGIVIDISEKRRVEKHLAQAQKMEAVGTLAGGMAHDFNNLLMGIQGRVSLLHARKDVPEGALTHLSVIEEHIESAAGLTRQLLGLARGGKYQPAVTDLNQLVQRSLELFARTHKSLTPVLDLQEDLWSARVDRHQLEQVLLNLLLNGWQAMPEGGELAVRTRNLELDADHAAAMDLGAGVYVCIAVVDTGVGMTEEVRRRIFEPFFTTREQERGTGLGLASAYGIVRNHGGAVEVESAPGEGSTFRVLVPAEPEEEPVQRKEVAEELPGGSETILVIDDEALILSSIQPLLEMLGYRTLTASSGRAALELLEADPARVDLIILDMVMPGLDGPATFERIRQIPCEARVLLSSGYSVEQSTAALMEQGCAFLQKPYRIEELARKLREQLDQSPALSQAS
ncbi:MAG: ATP-binding protein [Deltaproteobacteria bacterium]|nr:ATP-binding protein [Deltaproteobacteria bacterium]